MSIVNKRRRVVVVKLPRAQCVNILLKIITQSLVSRALLGFAELLFKEHIFVAEKEPFPFMTFIVSAQYQENQRGKQFQSKIMSMHITHIILSGDWDEMESKLAHSHKQGRIIIGATRIVLIHTLG